LAGAARQRRTTSFIAWPPQAAYRRAWWHTDQRNDEYGYEAMHWIDE